MARQPLKSPSDYLGMGKAYANRIAENKAKAKAVYASNPVEALGYKAMNRTMFKKMKRVKKVFIKSAKLNHSDTKTAVAAWKGIWK